MVDGNRAQGFQDEDNSEDGIVHQCECVNATQLYTLKWLKHTVFPSSMTISHYH